jgi:simple sugar transport system permease protein
LTVDEVFTWSLLAAGLRLATPILLAAIGGYLCERAGVFNIALEGMMLFGAFFAVAFSYWGESWLLGVMGGLVGGLVVAIVFAIFAVLLRSDEIVVGLTLNIVALGLTTFLLRAIFHAQGRLASDRISSIPDLSLPLGWVPGLGSFFSSSSPIIYLSWILAVATAVFLRDHPLGLRLRAAGESPAALEAAGVSIGRMRWLAILASGLLCGLAGTYLTLSELGQFTDNVTAGRGFIAIAAFMFGGGSASRVIVASLMFGIVDSFAIRAQGAGIPSDLALTLPYLAAVVAIVVLSIRGRRVQQGV